MKLHVNVRQEHIEKGHGGSVDSCPIALAIRDIPGVTSTNVNDYFISWVCGGVRYEAASPGVAEEFISRFDERNFDDPAYPDPVAFDLEGKPTE